MSGQKIEFATRMFKLLGHPVRLRIVELLESTGEMTVNEIADQTGNPQPTVSAYLNKLKDSGLLQCRRSGNQAYYSVLEPKLSVLLDCLRDCPLE
ncbi:MAG: metalloregulator ArsR/SmtB family transcription factor [Vulcanimicrobiota bacterium]